MTNEATKQFLSCARAELVRVEIALSDVPSLKLKRELLAYLLDLYGETNVGGRGDGSVVKVDRDVGLEKPAAAEPPAPKLTAPRVLNAAPRPNGIPSNYQMTYKVLKEGPADGMTAAQVVDKIRDRWWPGVVFNQIGPEFYRYVNGGRLVRDDDGRMTVTTKGEELARFPNIGTVAASADGPPAPNPKPKTVVEKRALFPRLTPEQIEEARAKAAGAVKVVEPAVLEHNDHKVILRPDEGRMANHLYNLMGSGFVDVEKLATVAGERKGASHRMYVEDLVVTVNRAIARAKLVIVPYEKVGFFMREIP